MTTAPVFLVARAVLDASDRVVLDGAEGRHAARVRRMATGEVLDLVDGDGLRARCIVDSVSADSLVALVQSREVEPEPQPRVVVVQALAKGDRGERAVEVLTEVGVDEIVPWSASRSVAQWHGDRGERSLERWRSTARESAKQARRARFPVISALATTRDVATRLAAATCGLVLDAAPEHLGAQPLPSSGDVVMIVGPEGGFAPPELDAFAAAGATVVGLGPLVLRTSTAGAIAVGLVLSRVRW